MPDRVAEVYPLAEPAEVDIGAIEAGLESIWRDCASHEPDAVLRAAAFTIVYAVPDAVDDSQVTGMLTTLVQSHPARVILLRLVTGSSAIVREAWVTSYCHRPAKDAPPVCSDYITIRAGGGDVRQIGSAVLPLLLSGVSAVLIWDAALAKDHPLLTELGSVMDRVIVSVIPPCGPASSLNGFFDCVRALGDRPLVTDLSEALLRSWHGALAAPFDAEPALAAQIREVRMRYSSVKLPAESLLLAAWISVVLQWTPQRIVLRGSHPSIVFDSDRAILFETDPIADESIDLVLSPSASGRVLRVSEPSVDNRLTSLLMSELEIWGADPLRTETFRRVRHWLSELLFS